MLGLLSPHGPNGLCLAQPATHELRGPSGRA